MKTLKIGLIIGLIAIVLVGGVFAYTFDVLSDSYIVDIGDKTINVTDMVYSKGVITTVVKKPVDSKGLTIQEVIALKEVSKTIRDDIDDKINVYDKFVIVQEPIKEVVVIKEVELVK